MTELLLWLAISANLILGNLAATDSFYTAAVFEHARFDNNDSSKYIVETNLEFYKKAIEVAKSKGADIIVFPEYGIFPPGDREHLKKFLETAPDPNVVHTIPCIEEGYSKKPILYSLSCMARNNSMFVVANTGDIQKCEGDPDCPTDGVFHFNTNVVFDRNGKLLVRYHKEHLYFEMGMDLARKQQNTTFKTDFGTFATYICFDIDFGRMSSVAQWPIVDGIAFSTMWLDILPQMASVQFWQSWSMGNNVTLLASNIQIPGWYAIGSGVFDGQNGVLGYTFNPDGISKLVVSKVPRIYSKSFSPNSSITAITQKTSWEFKDDGKDVPRDCSKKLLPEPSDIYTDYRCLEESTANYTLVKLEEPSGHLKACHNGMCCSLYYSTEKLTENFYLGVYNGTYNSYNRYFWCEENCVLARCEGYGDNPCSIFPVRSETVFQHVRLSGNFTTDFIYPSVVSSGMRLVPLSEWIHDVHDFGSSFNALVHYKNEPGWNLTAVGLKGRCYQRDPPYKR